MNVYPRPKNPEDFDGEPYLPRLMHRYLLKSKYPYRSDNQNDEDLYLPRLSKTAVQTPGTRRLAGSISRLLLPGYFSSSVDIFCAFEPDFGNVSPGSSIKGPALAVELLSSDSLGDPGYARRVENRFDEIFGREKWHSFDLSQPLFRDYAMLIVEGTPEQIEKKLKADADAKSIAARSLPRIAPARQALRVTF